ncbi:MAG TPA: hypothetical protein VMG82_27470 [Candidatus Sulfotelmatobacter sp.]|nr:hypothetical protein [Candidatus Sulfotelmatobacter sp.]
MNTPKNPLELIDRYLQAVRFWLPKTRRQEDLLAELGEDLRSQIEDKENELDRALDKDEISEILKRCGAPMVVASRLGPKRHLIGPTLYPIYEFVLKMVVLWIMVPAMLFIVGLVNLANSHGDWGKAIAMTLGSLWSGAFVAAGIITLVFAILERTHAIADVACKWDPNTLPPLEKTERRTSFFQASCELTFNVFGLVWLLLLPHHPFLVLGPASSFLTAGPIWSEFYAPIVLLAVAVIIRAVVILLRPQWGAFPLWSQLVQALLTLTIIRYMINAAGGAGQPGWHPFVTLAAGVRSAEDVARLTRLVAVINVSILLALVCTWIGLCIGAAVHTWQLLTYIRKRRISQEPASLQA